MINVTSSTMKNITIICLSLVVLMLVYKDLVQSSKNEKPDTHTSYEPTMSFEEEMERNPAFEMSDANSFFTAL
jgi:hypothetical protein